MAKKVVIEPRLPWEDRWTRPSVEQLLQPLSEQHHPLMVALIEQLAAFDHVEQTLVWYGPAWRWTIEFNLLDDAGQPLDKLAYIIANPAAPVICIPLREQEVDILSHKRLSKYIRDGIRSAKCAVELYWVGWTPANPSEVEHLVDLVKRKYKIRRGEDSPSDV